MGAITRAGAGGDWDDFPDPRDQDDPITPVYDDEWRDDLLDRERGGWTVDIDFEERNPAEVLEELPLGPDDDEQDFLDWVAWLRTEEQRDPDWKVPIDRVRGEFPRSNFWRRSERSEIDSSGRFPGLYRASIWGKRRRRWHGW